MLPELRAFSLGVSDPIITSNPNSHNRNNHDFLLDMSQVLQKEIAFGKSLIEPKFKNKSIKYSLIVLANLLIPFMDMFRFWRNSTYPIVYFNPNADPIWLFSSLIASKIFGTRVQIKGRLIGTRDWRILNTSLGTRLFKIVLKSKRVFISVETLSYKEYLEKLFGYSFCYLPFPPIDVLENQVNTQESENRYFFPGGSRPDKGIYDLPNLAKHLKGCNPEPMTFCLQEGIPKDILALIKASQVRTTILKRYLSDQEMTRELMNCHVILLPYQEKDFKYRGSSFCHRGIHLGKPMIIRIGTSLEKELNYAGYYLKFKVTEEMAEFHPSGESIQKFSSFATKSWEDLFG